MFTIAILLGLSAEPKPPAKPEMTVRCNIPYAKAKLGERRFRSLDVYSPKTGKQHPVMIFIHGGAWRIGDKRGVQEKPAAFVKNGYVFVSINYRIAPKTDWRTQAADVAAAVQYVHDHVSRVGGDPKRIFLMGHSAGAHLAALAAIDESYLKAAGLPLSAVKGVVLLDCACYDIPEQIANARVVGRKIYTRVFGTEKAGQVAASPVTHVKKGKGIPPFLILHVASRPDSRKQSHTLAEALKKAGVSAKVVAAKDKTHRTLNREFGIPNDETTREVFRFLKSQRKAKSKR